MNPPADPGLVIALLVSVLVLTGAAVVLIGAIGLLRLDGFYERIHASTMGTTMGMACVLLASMLLFTALGSRPIIHELIILVAMPLVTPIGFLMFVRAARHRDSMASETGAEPPAE